MGMCVKGSPKMLLKPADMAIGTDVERSLTKPGRCSVALQLDRQRYRGQGERLGRRANGFVTFLDQDGPLHMLGKERHGIGRIDRPTFTHTGSDAAKPCRWLCSLVPIRCVQASFAPGGRRIGIRLMQELAASVQRAHLPASVTYEKI